jgi:hypothetical protein
MSSEEAMRSLEDLPQQARIVGLVHGPLDSRARSCRKEAGISAPCRPWMCINKRWILSPAIEAAACK